MKLVSNCPLCEEKSLHVMGEKEAEIQQCINCGYSTTSKFIGKKEENEQYEQLTEELKKWPRADGNGFYNRRYDTDNPKVYDEFVYAMSELNDKIKNQDG